MLNVSEDFKLAMKQPVKELSAYIKNDDITITDADNLISFKISCESEICKTAMKKIEIKCYGDYNFLGNWFKAGFGVKLPNNKYEYLDYGSFLIDKVTTAKDTGITTAIGYDKMVSSMITYKEQTINYPLTLYNYAKKMCEQCNLVLYNENFIANNNFLIYEDLYKNINGITYRDIFVQIAEATATTCIIKDDKVYFKPIIETDEKLTYYNMKKLSLEEKYGEINCVVLSRTPAEDNIYYPETTEETQINEFKIENNEIVDKRREEAIVPIYNVLNGLNFYPFETTTEGLGWYEIADSFNIENESGDVYNTSLFNFTITIDGGINEILKATAKTKTQTQYQYATSISKRITNTEIIVDKQNQKITQIVEETTDTNEKISKVEQTVDELNSKISDVADITTMSESAYGKVTFTSINAGEPIYISIHPITNNISKMYPRTNLYPSNDLYMSVRILRFKNTKTNEIFNYELPDDLLCSGNIYDEFILNYDNQVCQIIKRRRYNSTGTTHVISEKRVDYPYPKIELTDGDYEVELVGYSTGYLQVRLMSQNIYTTQFATRAEVKSEIAQTATGINLEVAKKVGKEEIISSINQSAEQITIDANKISLNGKSINLTSDNIEIKSTNFNVDKNGNMKAQNGEFSGKITANSGYIGGQNGFTITENKIYNGKNTFDSNESGVYIGTNGIALGNDGAFLYSDGKAKFSNGLTVKSKNQNSVGFQLEGNTPYIDFLHNDSSESDFSSRIIENNPRRADDLCI